jgi:hypothetical protein
VGLEIGLDGRGENIFPSTLPPPGVQTPNRSARNEICCSSCHLIDSVVLEGVGLNSDLVRQLSINECFIFSNF